MPNCLHGLQVQMFIFLHFFKALEKQYVKIQQEYLSICNNSAQMDNIVNSVQCGSWHAYYFYAEGVRNDAHCAACPTSTALIEQVSLLKPVLPISYVYFSVISSNTYIEPHFGVCNSKLRIQLPILVPKQSKTCYLKVHDQVIPYEEGKCIVFDDSYLHEVKYETSTTTTTEQQRVVLLIDIWHPELTDLEKEVATLAFSTI